MEREVFPPFTANWRFTGPDTAISCEVDYDTEEQCWIATSSAGFRGAADSPEGAALACFEAWMTRRRAWFVPASEEVETEKERRQ